MWRGGPEMVQMLQRCNEPPLNCEALVTPPSFEGSLFQPEGEGTWYQACPGRGCVQSDTARVSRPQGSARAYYFVCRSQEKIARAMLSHGERASVSLAALGALQCSAASGPYSQARPV
eukprot:s5275_g9.t1